MGQSNLYAAGNATVNISSEKQKISGFGGSTAWNGTLSDAEADSVFNTMGLSILRVRIDPNNGWSEELSNAKKAVARGAIVFATPWTPPASYKDNNNLVSGSLLTSRYGDYASWLKSYGDYMKNNGVSLRAISVQNEPNIKVNYESCDWTSAQMANFIKNYGPNVGYPIMAPETFDYNTTFADGILNDATAAANTSIIAYHWYSNTNYSYYANAANKGKEVWMTEHYSDDQSMSGALATALEMHNLLTINNLNAYIWWYIKSPSCNLIQSGGAINRRGYVMGQFSKFVRPGYVRVDATSNPQTNVYVSAYKGDKTVIVAINNNTSAVSQTFALQGGTADSMTPYVTSDSANIQLGSNIAVSNGTFTATLPAQSVTTFVSNGQTLTPAPTPTTPTPTPIPSPKSAFTQIEAESYDAQSGVQTETCTEGGQNVGYIENGDYAVYSNVDFGSGASSFQARVASSTSGGNIEVRLDSITGPLVGTCSVAGTGGWQNWTDATCSVSGASGKHDLYLKFTGGSGYLFNINWFKFIAGGATSTPTQTPVPTNTPTPTPTGTATPTPTPTPTSTPTPTGNPTATPTPTPTNTPTPTGGVSPIKVQFFNGNTSASNNTIYTNFNLVNVGTSAIALSDVKMRYYFTNDGTQADSFACDWAAAGTGNITGTFTTTTGTNADRYIEVGFTSGAGTLAAGAGTEVKCRVWKSDWSNFTQTNDYSFNATATNYVDSNNITGYIAGTLKWGAQP